MAQLLLELGRLGEAKPPNEERDACGIWVPFFCCRSGDVSHKQNLQVTTSGQQKSQQHKVLLGIGGILSEFGIEFAKPKFAKLSMIVASSDAM